MYDCVSFLDRVWVVGFRVMDMCVLCLLFLYSVCV